VDLTFTRIVLPPLPTICLFLKAGWWAHVPLWMQYLDAKIQQKSGISAVFGDFLEKFPKIFGIK